MFHGDDYPLVLMWCPPRALATAAANLGKSPHQPASPCGVLSHVTGCHFEVAAVHYRRPAMREETAMGLDSVPMRLFISTIEKWTAALSQRDGKDARFFIEQLQTAAELLAIDPRFDKVYRSHVSGCSIINAPELVPCVCAFFRAITDANHSSRLRDDQDPQPELAPA